MYTVTDWSKPYREKHTKKNQPNNMSYYYYSTNNTYDITRTKCSIVFP